MASRSKPREGASRRARPMRGGAGPGSGPGVQQTSRPRGFWAAVVGVAVLVLAVRVGIHFFQRERGPAPAVPDLVLTNLAPPVREVVGPGLPELTLVSLFGVAPFSAGIPARFSALVSELTIS